MSESELEGFIQVAPYPLEAVPYQLFAKMIGRKESTVRTMIDAAKLPTIDFVKPGSVKTRASENWVYLPAFNAGNPASKVAAHAGAQKRPESLLPLSNYRKITRARNRSP